MPFLPARRPLFELLKETLKRCHHHNVPRLGASLAYYTAFSIAPLLLLTISAAGLIFGQEASEGKIVRELGVIMGSHSADALQTLIRNSSRASSGLLATLVGTLMLLVGASGVMVELKDALNLIWEVKGHTGLRAFFRDRFLSLGMILAIGFLLLVSLFISAALAALGRYFQYVLPLPEALLQITNFIIAFGVIVILFATIFKALPDAKIKWRDVWVGAGLTSFLFSVGKSVLGIYLGKGIVGSSYGAAGSVFVTLLWVYYSAQVLYVGAEFTKVFADRYGSGIHPSKADMAARVRY
jgi:membrane protein